MVAQILANRLQWALDLGIVTRLHTHAKVLDGIDRPTWVIDRTIGRTVVETHIAHGASHTVAWTWTWTWAWMDLDGLGWTWTWMHLDLDGFGLDCRTIDTPLTPPHSPQPCHLDGNGRVPTLRKHLLPACGQAQAPS
jgi:hypothetical protein